MWLGFVVVGLLLFGLVVLGFFCVCVLGVFVCVVLL